MQFDLDQASFEQVDEADVVRQIRHQTVRYLSYREHATSELRIKLRKKFGTEAEIERLIDQVLEHFIAEDLINEFRYAESYIRSRVNKGYGPENIRNELITKGIPKSIVDRAIDDCDIDWGEVIYRVWLKKYRNVTDIAEEKAKQWRFLQYSGFSREQIKILFDCYLYDLVK